MKVRSARNAASSITKGAGDGFLAPKALLKLFARPAAASTTNFLLVWWR
jgi:hypothetical protein